MTQKVKLEILGGCEVSDVVYDSRKATFGTLFVCLRGAVTDGHKFAPKAYENGCRHFAVEQRLELPDDAVQYVFDDTRVALAEISAEFYGYPAKKLHIVGVTGTKGKTSVSTYIYTILNSVGLKCGFIGTTGVDYGPNEAHEKTVNSTPESRELHRIFAQMVDVGCKYVVMEVSSQAYKTGRVHGIRFDYGIFTNLSHDHISPVEHPDYADYRRCKSMLFENADCAVLNIDDEASEFMAERSHGRIITCSAAKSADYSVSTPTQWRDESSLGIDFTLNGVKLRVMTPGGFSALNASLAAAFARDVGIAWSEIHVALASAVVKGRFEIVPALPYATCIIDYAHNEVSLQTALRTLADFKSGRIVCLFGSIGGRAELRRSGMAKVAAQYADFTIVTSDNPDFEEPEKIIADIVAGLDGAPHVAISDRAEAIRYAIENARSGDIILFAGKGHEDYQIIEGKHVPFCERDLILRFAAERSAVKA